MRRSGSGARIEMVQVGLGTAMTLSFQGHVCSSDIVVGLHEVGCPQSRASRANSRGPAVPAVAGRRIILLRGATLTAFARACRMTVFGSGEP